MDFGPLRRRLVEYFVAQQCWPVFSAWADKREGKKKKGNVGHITEEKKTCDSASHEFTQAPTDFGALIPCQRIIFLFMLI